MDTKFNNAVYNFWVEVNYKLIEQSLINSNRLDKDALHDALIDTYTEVRELKNISLDAIGKVFNKCYRLASKRIVNIGFQYIAFEDDILEFIINENYVPEDNVRESQCKNIVRLTRNVLTREEYKLLTLYVWSDNMSLDNLSIYTGIPRSTLYRKIVDIKSKVGNNITI